MSDVGAPARSRSARAWLLSVAVITLVLGVLAGCETLDFDRGRIDAGVSQHDAGLDAGTSALAPRQAVR